jgi:transcriptional regulator with XRE-family HTH domain
MYQKGITQAQMSRELGIGKSTLSTWMSGQRMPRMDKIDILCRYLNCMRSDLMDEKREKRTETTFTQEEMMLIVQYRMLNAEGRARVRDDMENYLELPKYTRKGDASSNSADSVIA